MLSWQIVDNLIDSTFCGIMSRPWPFFKFHMSQLMGSNTRFGRISCYRVGNEPCIKSENFWRRGWNEECRAGCWAGWRDSAEHDNACFEPVLFDRQILTFLTGWRRRTRPCLLCATDRVIPSILQRAWSVHRKHGTAWLGTFYRSILKAGNGCSASLPCRLVWLTRLMRSKYEHGQFSIVIQERIRSSER